MMFRKFLTPALAIACSVMLGGDAAAAGGSPILRLVMKPQTTGDAAGHIGVTMTFVQPQLAAGQGLVRLSLKIVGIPSARYDGDALTARDDAGPLPLEQADEPPIPQGVYRVWKVTRASVGDVVVSYQAPPRKVIAATNNGPLFDLRAENGGFIGAGVGFLAAPAMKDAKYHVLLHWDLSDVPAGSRGAWSLGDGDVDTVVTAEDLAFSFYAAGPLQRYPEGQGGKSALYWLSKPPFDPAALGKGIDKLYAYMAHFFGAADPSYRVFIRQNPYSGQGGTALIQSFMFGYNADEKPTLDDLQSILSHEMTHNWPKMDGDGGEIAWYNEGVAEYYSNLLSYRAGVISTDRYLSEINKKALAYYTNPYVSYTNGDAARQYWADPVAQTVPYGRGLMFLIQTDAAIRAASHGQRSLDNVVLELYARKTRGEPYGAAQWLDLLSHEIGAAAARRDYDAMLGGKVLIASSRRFAPCFRTTRKTVHVFQLGFARASLNDDRVVRDLQPGSAADRAGVRNGDVIVSASDIVKVRKDENLPMTMVLRRDGRDIPVTYTPRGPALTAYQWVRNPQVPSAACQF